MKIPENWIELKIHNEHDKYSVDFYSFLPSFQHGNHLFISLLYHENTDWLINIIVYRW